MQHFAQLYQALDASTATTAKVAALVAYFRSVGTTAPADAAWAVYFLAGGKPRQVLPTARLREAACAQAGIDDWLFDACYQAVGDLAETLALVLPPATQRSQGGLAYWVEDRLAPLRGLEANEQIARIQAALAELNNAERFLLVKLIGGGFRVGVSKLLVQRALAEYAGVDAKHMAQRLVGCTQASATPTAARFAALVAPLAQGTTTGEPGQELLSGAIDAGQPYPFFLAHPLQADPSTLGPVADWLVEWKYDGIRAQVVKRRSQVSVWSRGEELLTESFPDVVAAASAWPDGTVLDGELLVWPDGASQPQPFKELQTRITRKTISKKLLASTPVVLLAYDLLEVDGADQRTQPQHARRAALLALADSLAIQAVAPALRVSPQVQANSWTDLALLRSEARARGVEGLMLKQQQARYGTGRTKTDGLWLKWKVDPLSVDAVLIYAQAGHGRRASLYTDYTFAVWNRQPNGTDEVQVALDRIAQRAPAPPGALQLLPFAKAYSGLTDDEFKAVDRVVRATTLEKFGPVRSVRPTLVFELGFEGIQTSPRHKSGVAVRFPRMLRLRSDKTVADADTLATLQALMPPA
jgi:DNA ligase 1